MADRTHSGQAEWDYSQPLNWKKEAQEILLFIFRAAAQRSFPSFDLRPLTSAILEVIGKALLGAEERIIRYAGHVTQAARQGRGLEEAKLLLEMETSVKFYFEERLRAAGGEPSQGNPTPTPTPTSDGTSEDKNLHVRALDRCHDLLMRDLIVKESSLIDGMIQFHLISVAGGDEIRKKTTDRAKNLEVLRLARGLTLQQFTDLFLPALRNGHEHLADTLVRTMAELRGTASLARCRVCSLRGRMNIRRLAGPLLEKRLISHDFSEDLLGENMPIMKAWKQLFRHVGHTQRLLPILRETYPGVVEEMEKRDISSLECPCLMPEGLLGSLPTPDVPENLSDNACFSDVASTLYPRKTAVPEYSMTLAKRGLCLVVENSVYTKPPNQREVKKFEGTTRLIQEEFQRLGFQIVKHSNLTATQLMEEARRMAALDHSQHNCFACVVRSRNKDSDTILCSDRAAVGVQDLMDVFNASHCSSLAGKPKIFYIVMNRGGTDQGGVAVPGETGQELHPDGADFLLIQTALPGFNHPSNPDLHVPVHLEHLAGVLQHHAHTQDFLSCLAMAHSQYASLKSTNDGYFTAPVTSTLRKALVFRQLP